MNAAKAASTANGIVTMPSEARPKFEVQHGPKLGDQPPALAPEAFYGIAGKFVRLVEPHTEADPAAILAQFLVAAGNMIGRGPHVRAEADEHHPNLFVAIVGASSKARKGSSWGHVRRLFAEVDPEYAERNIVGGLSSGEGLIAHVRDEGINSEECPGVDDKRVLVFEGEMARPLQAAGRQGNILSTVIRHAWDGVPLRVMTRKDALSATGAHISIAAHITTEELRSDLQRTDIANGFANRFLWFYSKRSKLLPDGGGSYDAVPLADCLRVAIQRAKRIGCVQRDEAAKALWHDVYPKLSEAQPGDFGKVTSRSEAQVMRLSLLYALLDGSEYIQAAHLRAALAVWEHAEHSAAYIFDSVVTDPTTRRIVAALEQAGPDGLRRTDISQVLGRNVPSNEIQSVLDHLKRQGKATRGTLATAGRPVEVWALTLYEITN